MPSKSEGFFLYLAEKMGFEPMRDLHPLAVFETAPFDHLGISPAKSIPLFIASLYKNLWATYKQN